MVQFYFLLYKPIKFNQYHYNPGKKLNMSYFPVLAFKNRIKITAT